MIYNSHQQNNIQMNDISFIKNQNKSFSTTFNYKHIQKPKKRIHTILRSPYFNLLENHAKS